MYHSRQLAAWMAAASLGAAALGAGGVPWPAGAGIALAVTAVTHYILYRAPQEGLAAASGVLPRALRVTLMGAESAWAALMTGVCAQLGGASFPGLEAGPAIPLGILALAAAGVHPSRSVPARTAAVLYPLLAAFLGAVAVFTLAEGSAGPGPVGTERQTALLLPLCAALLPPGEGKVRRGIWCGLTALGAGLLYAAAERAGSLTAAAEGVRILGVMERFEALVAAASAAGTVCTCMLTAQAGMEALRAAAPHHRKTGERLLWMLAVAGIGLAGRIPEGMDWTLTPLFWGFVPVMILVVVNRKKDQKRC